MLEKRQGRYMGCGSKGGMESKYSDLIGLEGTPRDIKLDLGFSLASRNIKQLPRFTTFCSPNSL